MEINEFETYTGIILTEAQAERYDVLANRALKRLQKLLGWEISSSDDYEEAGQLLNTTAPINQKTLDIESLEEPDEVVNTWRLFPFYDMNTNLRIDPCTAVYNVKLVIPLIGDETRFVTIYNFDTYIPLVGKTVDRSQYITYIKKAKEISSSCGPCRWVTNVPLLAVDAEWISRSFPDDLMQILADLIVYEFQNQPSLAADANRPLKSISQSVDGHSISKAYSDTTTSKKIGPLDDDNVLNILKEYIGPYSPLYKERRIY